MSNIQADLRELGNLERELKNINQKAKALRKRKELINARIVGYCRANDLPGIKHQGIAIRLEEKTSRSRKKKKEKEYDQLSVLKSYGIHNPEVVLQEIMDAGKGEEIAVDKLKIKKYK